jgi:hypothetical protein
MRCPYCIGTEAPQPVLVFFKGRFHVAHTTRQVEHDRACPARRAPLGTRMDGLPYIAEPTQETT